MKTEVLEKAKELENQIILLEKEKLYFNKENKWVHLQVQDHYGNKGCIIKTYAQSYELTTAMGYELQMKIPEEYGLFIGKINKAIQDRIDYLKSKLEQL